MSPGTEKSPMSSMPSALMREGSVVTGMRPSLPPDLEYFHSCLDQDRTRDWLREERERGRKIIGLMAWGVPAEIVLASGAVPVRLAGLSWDRRRILKGLPRDICPLAASCVAEALFLEKEGLLDAVVLPETCDWKRKLPTLLGELSIITLAARSAGDVFFVAADLKRFARELALITDLPVVPRNLKRASQTMAHAHDAYVALQRLRQLPENRLSGVSALAIERSFLRDDLSCWTEHSRRLVRRLEQVPLSKREKLAETPPRIMLVGSPALWKEASLVHIVEESGGEVVCEDFHSRLSLLYSDETGVSRAGASASALASRWSRSCFCSLAAEADAEFLARAIGDLSVEGVVLHMYRSCARVQMSLPHLLRRLKDRGIPSLAIETQGDPHEEEQVRARIEPFVEMLLERRRNGT